MMGQSALGLHTALRELADQTGVSTEQRAAATSRYDDFGAWIKDHVTDQAVNISVYPQGSFRIGTTNTDDDGHFDVDAVVHFNLNKRQITQDELRARLTHLVTAYIQQRQQQGHALAPSAVEHKARACTLSYAYPFHVDLLPVINDAESSARTGRPALLTDRLLTRWQHTNPAGFATWFDQQMLDEGRTLAKAEVEIEELPRTGKRTTLQLTVQILKMHAKHHFASDADVCPPSIVITTLAARAYAAGLPRGARLDNVVSHVVTRMPASIEWRHGDIWVPNPVNPDENFADRVTSSPDRVHALEAWLAQAQADFAEMAEPDGLAVLAKRMDSAFGDGRGRAVAAGLSQQVAQASKDGRVARVAAGPLLIGTTRRPIKPNTFYGRA